MKKTGWTRRALCLLTLLALLSGTAAAESWPSESITDSDGFVWKKVPQDGGGYQVWQFVGVFGSKEDALKAVGLTEETPEKKAEEEPGGAVTIKSKKHKVKKKKGKATEKTAPPLKWSVTEKKEEPVQETVVDSQGKTSRRLKWRKRKNKTDRYIVDIGDLPRIYLQDNRGSGR